MSRDKKAKKAVTGTVCGILCVLIAFAGIVVFFARDKLSRLNYNSGIGGDPNATFNYDDEDMNFRLIGDVANAESIKELVKSWATNGGDKMYSKKVINVLLIGEDDEDGSHRSDSCILVSINTATKKIILTSFLRDSYSYMNIEGQDRYDKTNHSYSWGGAAKLMEVLSDNYKIKIDHYVSIGYESFINAINDLGGVRVSVTEAEANFMNRTTRMKGFESGENVLLDGEHALVFARIRKLDGEPERTERQRRLIESFIKSVKDSSLSDVNNAIDNFLPYVTTNYPKKEIVSLGTRAIKEGWLKYDIVSNVAPSEETRAGFRGYPTSTGNLDVWIVDYIKAARELQLTVYGKTNITINEETHISAIDLAYGSVNTDAQEESTDQYGFFGQNWNDYSFYNPIGSMTVPNIIGDIIDGSRPSFPFQGIYGGYGGAYADKETTTSPDNTSPSEESVTQPDNESTTQPSTEYTTRRRNR